MGQTKLVIFPVIFRLDKVGSVGHDSSAAMEAIMLEREEDQQKAMESVSDILPVLYGILDEAVAFYFSGEYSDAARAEHSNTTAANCIYSHAEKRMIAAADATHGRHPLKRRGLHVLNYKDRALARFKKVKPNGKHSNFQTKQQQDYDDQKSFPGFPEPAYRLTAGYQRDASGSYLERIMIARPLGRSILWTAQVSMVEGLAQWEDITPKRFAGTEATDFNAKRARGENE